MDRKTARRFTCNFRRIPSHVNQPRIRRAITCQRARFPCLPGAEASGFTFECPRCYRPPLTRAVVGIIPEKAKVPNAPSLAAAWFLRSSGSGSGFLRIGRPWFDGAKESIAYERDRLHGISGNGRAELWRRRRGTRDRKRPGFIRGGLY